MLSLVIILCILTYVICCKDQCFKPLKQSTQSDMISDFTMSTTSSTIYTYSSFAARLKNGHLEYVDSQSVSMFVIANVALLLHLY